MPAKTDAEKEKDAVSVMPWRPWVLYAADYGHGHALRPGLDVGFADFRHVKVRLCQCVKVRLCH